jgi:hypothetical protein
MRAESRRSAFLLPVAAMAAAAIAAGCGEGNTNETGGNPVYDPEASTTMLVARPPLTKARFVERVNKICRKAWGIVLENWMKFAKQQNPAKSKKERFDEAVRLPLLSGIDFYIFDRIRELGAPSGEEQEIEAVIGPFQIAVELGWKKRWRAYSAAEVVPHFKTYNERAERYGLDDCLVEADPLSDLGP